MINLVPNLMPQIKHSEVISAIEQFKLILDKEEIDRRLFNKAMTFFQSYNFYLTKAECDQINNLRKQIEAKDGDNGLRIIFSDLQPNDEMNDSFYLEE